MTVIAWDGQTLAADKRGSQNGFVYTVTKLFRVGDRIVGYAGNAGRIGEFRAWLESGANPKTYPKNDHDDQSNCVWMLAILLDANGRVVIEKYEQSGYPIVVEEKHFASGNGRDYATAAMHLGHDAKAAVEVACLFDESCGNGIDTLTLAEA